MGVNILIRKLLLLAALVGTSLTAISLAPFPYDHPLAMLIDKRDILEKTPSPRLVVIGGSGAFSGFDSALMGKELGREVVNMGLLAGLGVVGLLDMVDPLLRPGDDVLIVPEYTILQKDFQSTDEARKWLLAAAPRARLRSYLDAPGGWKHILSDGLELQKLKAWKLKAIGRRGYISAAKLLGPNGDALKPARKLTSLGGRQEHFAFQPSMESMERLNSFRARVVAQGGEVYFLWPAFPRADYEANRAEIEKLRVTLDAALTPPILGAPTDFTFPDDHFMDTVYHLSSPAMRLRTRRAMDLLRGQMKGGLPPS